MAADPPAASQETNGNPQIAAYHPGQQPRVYPPGALSRLQAPLAPGFPMHGCASRRAAPQNPHKSASRAAPTGIPLFRRTLVPEATGPATAEQPL